MKSKSRIFFAALLAIVGLLSLMVLSAAIAQSQNDPAKGAGARITYQPTGLTGEHFGVVQLPRIGQRRQRRVGQCRPQQIGEACRQLIIVERDDVTRRSRGDSRVGAGPVREGGSMSLSFRA